MQHPRPVIRRGNCESENPTAGNGEEPPLRSAFAPDGHQRKRELFGEIGNEGTERILPRRPERFRAKRKHPRTQKRLSRRRGNFPKK